MEIASSVMPVASQTKFDVATINTLDMPVAEETTMTSHVRHYNAVVTVTSASRQLPDMSTPPPETASRAANNSSTFYFHHEVYELPITITLAICMTLILMMLVLIAVLGVYARIRGWKRHRHREPVEPPIDLTDKLGCSLRRA